MPLVWRELADVQIISARTRYEKKYPRNYQKWKIEAFLETKKELDSGAITNLLAFGDNNFEIEAAIILGSKLPNSLIKTVKFKGCPTPEEMIKQIRLVLDNFNSICYSAKHLTVKLQKQADPAKPKTQAASGCELDHASQASAQMLSRQKEMSKLIK